MLLLHEDVSIGTGRVTGNVIKGVKILGLESANGRRYLPEAIRRAVPKYEGAAVYLDHPDPAKRNATRSVRDKIGRLSNVKAREGGLFGDLTINEGHPHAEQVLWAAVNDPTSLGLSHNAEGKGRTSADGIDVIDEIVSVASVDLVADPATTKGLYESTGRRRFPALTFANNRERVAFLRGEYIPSAANEQHHHALMNHFGIIYPES